MDALITTSVLDKGGEALKDAYYLFQSGELQRRNNTLLLISKSGRKHYIPVMKVDSVHAFGNIILNSRLLDFLSQMGIALHTYNYYGNYTGTYYPKDSNISGFLHVKQAQYFLDPKKRLEIAVSIVHASIHNMIRIITRYSSTVPIMEELQCLHEFKNAALSARSIHELMGYEGSARKAYYQAFAKALDVDFEGRLKRPPKGRLNALISFGNTLLYTETVSRIYQTQLDPSVSFLHEPSTRRFSLCLDLAEMFKPVIVDRIISTLVGKNILNDSDFDDTFDGTYLSRDGKRKFVELFSRRLKETVTYPRLKRKLSYRNIIQQECYKLIKHLLGIEPYSAFRVWW